MSGLPHLVTSRLRLRQWRATDREPFAALNAAPDVMEFFPAVLARAASDSTAERMEQKIAERGWGFWAVELLDTGEFIGFVGLNDPAGLPFSPCIEVGWRLARRFWGHGYAVEAANAALRTGFQQLALDEVLSFTAAGNLRSRRVMEKLGMSHVPVTFEHPAVPVGNPLRTHVLYRLTREQWQASTGSDVNQDPARAAR